MKWNYAVTAEILSTKACEAGTVLFSILAAENACPLLIADKRHKLKCLQQRVRSTIHISHN